MAVCSFCVQEMTTADSCKVRELHEGGEARPLIPYGSEGGGWARSPRCGDCGVRRGGFHHLGCDIQRCPRCRGQMLSCGCLFDEDRACEPGGAGPELFVDAAGDPAERVVVGGQAMVLHHADIPPEDVTVVDGIPCTTALRTIIDLAPELSRPQLERMLDAALGRGLFTVDEAWRRLAKPDLSGHRGAAVLRRQLPAEPRTS